MRGLSEGLSDTLKAELQKESFVHLAKITLSKTGKDDVVYTKDLILDISDPEDPWSQTAKVVLDNGDKALNALNFKGWKGVISKGAVTPVGEEYCDGPFLWVIAQRFNSSEEGEHQLTCELSLIGIPNRLAKDKASRNYIPDEDDTKTIETLLTEIMRGTLGCFSHCKSYTVVFDDEEEDWFATSLLHTYKPKDSLRIYKGNSRSAIAKKLLDSTKSVMIAKADGNLHVFRPQITGTPVYTYSLASGHTFYSKAYREALVIPNFILASSPPPTVPNWVIVVSGDYSGEAKDLPDIAKFGERKHTADYGAGTFESDAECKTQAESDLEGYQALHDDYFEGTATDDVSIAAIGEIREFWEARFEGATQAEGDAQAELVAIARLAKHTLNAEMGAANVPMNVGAEVYDYIKVTDEREGGSERTGTTGSLRPHYNWGEPTWEMSFSLGQRPKAVDVMAAIEEDAPYFGRLIVDNLYAKNILAESLDMYWIDPDGTIDLSKIGDNLDNLPDGEVYARVKTLHLDAEGGIKMDEHIIFDEGYNPTTKESAIHRGTTPPEDLTKLWIDTTTELNVVKRYNGVTAQWERASPANLDQLEDGTDYARVKSMALNTDGLVLIDQIYTVGGDFGLVKSMGLTADGLILMDELIDGDYGRVKSAGLSAQGLVLLDQVVEGDYGRVYAADISAHHIKLSSVEQTPSYRTVSDGDTVTWNGKEIGIHKGTTAPTDTNKLWIDISVTPNVWKRYTGTVWVKCTPTEISEILISGFWYDESGVALDATKGIGLYGGQISLKTYPTKADYLADTNVQCYVGADGKIYAGAGAVIIGAGGITVIGQLLEFKDGVNASLIYQIGEILRLSSATIDLLATDEVIVNSTYLRPGTNDSFGLGTSAKRWHTGYINRLHVPTELYIPAEA